MILGDSGCSRRWTSQYGWRLFPRICASRVIGQSRRGYCHDAPVVRDPARFGVRSVPPSPAIRWFCRGALDGSRGRSRQNPRGGDRFSDQGPSRSPGAMASPRSCWHKVDGDPEHRSEHRSPSCKVTRWSVRLAVSLYPRHRLQHLQRPTPSDFPKNIAPVSQPRNGPVANRLRYRLILSLMPIRGTDVQNVTTPSSFHNLKVDHCNGGGSVKGASHRAAKRDGSRTGHGHFFFSLAS